MATPDAGTDRWRRLEDIFHAALEADLSDRSVLLSRLCGNDAGLRNEVESLLNSADKTLGFLAKPVEDAARAVADAPVAIGQRIGPYQLLKELGEGGMGKVYLAARADDHYQRQVAIKVMHAMLGASPVMLARFRAERQILANLDHPNIARLLDGGVTSGGLQYLVMEYVDGVTIDEFCRRNKLLIEPRLKLFLAVCGAVEYAHHNLVIHRDIKPANILVTAEGVPKLLDFGIAKLLDADLGYDPNARTRTTERLMTPEYASPEQIRGEPITTATDVYGLGVLLYELLAGARPFRVTTRSPLEAALIICEHQPALPSVTGLQNPETAPADARKLKGELDNVVLMAMRKEPERRYASVSELSADVSDYLRGYPLRARTDTWGYRSAKFVRRHKSAVAATVALVLALIGFSVGMGLLAQKARREQMIAQREAEFLKGLFQAAMPEEAQGRTITARDLLDSGAQRVDRELSGDPEVRASMLESIAEAYRSLGLFDQAEAFGQRSYDLRAKTLGANRPQLADPLDLLASVARLKGQYEKAEPNFRRVVSLRRQALGENDLLVAAGLGELGECLYLEGKDAEAEPTLRQALAIYRRNGPNTGDEVRNYLALLLERKGQYPEATQLLREAVEIGRRTGVDTPGYAISLHNFASVLITLGDLSGAETHLREALAIRRKVLGQNHPDVYYSLNNLGYLLVNKGDWAGAEPFTREALALALRSVGEEHPFTAGAHNGLARVLEAKGEYAEAEKQFQQALDILRHANQGESWSAAQISLNLGMLETDWGKYSQAEALARQSVERLRKLGGENNPFVATALVELAEDRILQHDPKSAEPMLREAVGIRQKMFLPNHPSVIQAQVRLGEALTAEGEAAQAEPILRGALASARTAPFPLARWQVAEAESALGGCLTAMGRFREAQELLEKSEAGIRTDPRPVFRRQSEVRMVELERSWHFH